MKKGAFIVFLLLLPFAIAIPDNYHNFSSVTLDINVSASARALYEERPSLDELQAKIFFFPRDEFPSQVLLSQDVITDPEATLTREKTDVDEFLKIVWRDHLYDIYKYQISSRVKTVNYIPKVTTKIEFPLSALKDDVARYTKGTEFINIDDDIRNKANEIIEGQTDYYKVVFKLADWVQKNVQYNLTTLTAEAVQNSSWVLENREGVCDELTNLFISLARSVGIPARFVSGQVYTNIEKTFGNHGWAEVFFPEYGWIPVDVTFGQYGWVDPSHVIYDARLDSGESAIEYSWLARDIDFKFNPLSIETNVAETTGGVQPLAEISVELLRKHVAPGSFVPLQVKVRNPQAYYLPITVRVSKAPGLVEKNWEPLLLSPLEETSLFFTVKTPLEAEENYIYSTVIEVEGTFGEIAQDELKFSQGAQFFSEDWAQEQIALLKPREDKAFFPGMDLNCHVLDAYYYRKDTVNLQCTVMNNGNTRFNDLRVCYEATCKTIDLGISESKELSLVFPAAKVSDRIKVSAESKGLVKYDYPAVNIVEVPEVTVEQFSPSKIGYQEKGNISFIVNSSVIIHDLEADITGVGKVVFKDFGGRKTVLIPFSGKEVAREDVILHVNYEDDASTRYDFEQKHFIEVSDIPLFWKFIFWVERLFK